MTKFEPSREHRWLQQFVGEWTYEGEGFCDPGKPAAKMTGSETVRAIGDLWVVGSSQGSVPGMDSAQMMITIGFDPQRGKFVSAWVGSMMPSLWVSEGTLDDSGKTLTLECDGPSMSGDGVPWTYRDVDVPGRGDARRAGSPRPPVLRQARKRRVETVHDLPLPAGEIGSSQGQKLAPA